MTETAPIQENEVSRITPREVWTKYTGFQGEVKNGFSSKEAELTSYTDVIQKVNAFFQQPDISLNSSGPATLANRLFYRHDAFSESPIGFFADAAEQLRENRSQGKDDLVSL